MKDEMISKEKFNPGDKFILEIGEKRMALDEYEIVGTDLWVWGSLLEKLTPYEPDHNAEISKKVGDDSISRQAAIKALHDEIVRRRINEDSNDDGALDEFDTEAILRRLPPAQPESNDDAEFWRKRAEFYEKTCFDLIANMSDGVKIDSIIIDENGIKFTKKQPDRKSVNGRKEISGGIDGTALVRG